MSDSYSICPKCGQYSPGGMCSKCLREERQVAQNIEATLSIQEQMLRTQREMAEEQRLFHQKILEQAISKEEAYENGGNYEFKDGDIKFSEDGFEFNINSPYVTEKLRNSFFEGVKHNFNNHFKDNIFQQLISGVFDLGAGCGQELLDQTRRRGGWGAAYKSAKIEKSIRITPNVSINVYVVPAATDFSVTMSAEIDLETGKWNVSCSDPFGNRDMNASFKDGFMEVWDDSEEGKYQRVKEIQEKSDRDKKLRKYLDRWKGLKTLFKCVTIPPAFYSGWYIATEWIYQGKFSGSGLGYAGLIVIVIAGVLGWVITWCVWKVIDGMVMVAMSD